jgi:hypothetical protein
MIQQQGWILFDPDQSDHLSDEEFIIYEQYREAIVDGFRRLRERKNASGIEVKLTPDVGEIDSLAAAMVLSVEYICSNDYEIREVIEAEQLWVSQAEDEPLGPIVQNTIEDICVMAANTGIASKREVRNFFGFVNGQDPKWKQKAKLAKLDHRLD